MSRALPLLLLLCFALKAVSQPFYRVYEALPAGQTLYLPTPATGLVLEVPAAAHLRGARLVVGTDTFSLQPTAHDNPALPGARSEPVVLPSPTYEATLLTTSDVAATRWHAVYAPPLPIQTLPSARPADACSLPVAISQAVWRAGLPAPSYPRIENEVAHVIVHHSATSNTLTDYVNVVRNIYLFHTQSNGWSDIGYNYLIAPDGTLFAGRDPGPVAQDDVRGAHFCGKNTATMGVCLLGTYTLVPPPLPALTTLLDLTAWKLNKEALGAYDSAPHPPTLPGAPPLPAFAGHRDGCATECPGTLTYTLLPTLRDSLAARLANCVATALPTNPLLPAAVYPQPAQEWAWVEAPGATAYRLRNALGQVVRKGAAQPRWALDLRGLPAGVYALRLAYPTGASTRRVLIR